MERVLRILGKETVWKILEELSKAPKTPTELAKAFDMSVANVDNFISRLLDLGLVKKIKKIKEGRGRPFTQYGLGKEFAFIILPGKRYYIELDEQNKKKLDEVVKLGNEVE